MPDPFPPADPDAVTYDTTGEVSLAGTLPAYPDAELVRDAVDNAIAATEPHLSGTHALYFTLAQGQTLERVDTRDDSEPEPERHGVLKFTNVASLAAYVNRYRSDDSLGYIADVNGAGVDTLRKPTGVVRIVLNDHPIYTDAPPHTMSWHLVGGHRDHRAVLVLKPTAAALRWGAVLDTVIDQERLLDLVVDGVAEIVSPASADLRELVSDLHAIRTAEVKSVIRTGGEGRIEVTENVKLHAGVGSEVTFPERIDIRLQPFVGLADWISLPVRVKADARGNKVVFTLTAPDLEDRLTTILEVLADDVTAQTELPLMWVPALTD